jgi:GIY-YIG catalytic domain
MDWIRVGAVLGCCVYALRYKGEVVYIGKAKNGLSRLYTHQSNWRRHVKGRGPYPTNSKVVKFDDVSVYPCTYAELDAIEQAFIVKYAPRHNHLHNAAPNTYKARARLVPIPKLELKYPLTLKLGNSTFTLKAPGTPKEQKVQRYDGFTRRTFEKPEPAPQGPPLVPLKPQPRMERRL